MNTLADSPDVLAALRDRKALVKSKMQASRTQMMEKVNGLKGGATSGTAGKLHSISRLVTNGLFIYQGIRLASSIVSGIQTIFFPRKRRR